jgi:ribosomal-protein-alanine N-acetyltransferase
MVFRDAFTRFPVIETPRLVLRELVSEDAEDYFEQLRSAFEVPGRPPWAYGFELKSVDSVRASIGFSRKAWEKKARIKWGLALKGQEARVIGQCELFDIANQSKAELGYWLGPEYQGQGLMAEALRAVVQMAFGPMEMHRVYAKTDVENEPSLKMLARVGFVREGVLRQDSLREGRWRDSVLMAVLRD